MTDILSTVIQRNAWNLAATRALTPSGVTVAQAAVILHLAERGPVHIGKVADVLSVSRGNLTGIIERLERDENITAARDKNDRRAVTIALTEKGAALVPQIIAALDGVGAEVA